MMQSPVIALCALLVAGSLTVASVHAQSAPPAAAGDLSGFWTGRRCPTGNSDVCPVVTPAGAERVLTARGKAFVAAFDQLAAPKYDCGPAPLPSLLADPYIFQIEPRPDRVIIRYEKDDIVRTIWLDGHGHKKPAAGEFFVHGYSTGRYDGNALVVETTKFTFDPEGLADDLLAAPSSTQKRVTERYTRKGDSLVVELTTEDPIFLREPIKLALEYQRSKETIQGTWDCNVTAARRNLNVVPTKYPQDPAVIRVD